MRDRRSELRMMCADMVEVEWDDSGRRRHTTALLEDISPSGACVQVEAPLPLGTALSMSCPGEELQGVVRYCVYRDIGYFVGVSFAHGQRWSRRHFKPQHLLDLDRLVERANRKVPRS